MELLSQYVAYHFVFRCFCWMNAIIPNTSLINIFRASAIAYRIYTTIRAKPVCPSFCEPIFIGCIYINPSFVRQFSIGLFFFEIYGSTFKDLPIIVNNGGILGISIADVPVEIESTRPQAYTGF